MNHDAMIDAAGLRAAAVRVELQCPQCRAWVSASWTFPPGHAVARLARPVDALSTSVVCPGCGVGLTVAITPNDAIPTPA